MRRAALGNLPTRLLLSVLAVALVAATTPGVAVDDPALIAAAKKEGAVVLYGALNQVQLSAIAQRFEAAYGIKTQTLRMESTQIPGRVMTEERTGRGVADVVSDGGIQMDLLKRQGLFAQFRPPENAALIAGAFDPDGYWSSVIINTEVIAYNPVRLKAAGIKPPRSWEDLAGKEWRGQFGLFVGSYEWYQALRRYYGQDRADALMRAYAANKPHLLGSKQLGIEQVETGDILAAPNMYGYNALFEKRKGAQIDFVNPSPTFIELYPVAVMKDAPHPYAARLLLRWWLSRDTQRWQAEALGRLSSRKDADNDPLLFNAKIRFQVNPPADSIYYNDAAKAFNALFDIPN